MSRPWLAVVVCGTVIAGCASTSVDAPRTHDPVAVAGAHHAGIARASLTRATLDVVSGTTAVGITMGDLHGGLVTAATKPTSSQRPILDADRQGVVNLSFASVAGSGQPGVAIVLDRSVVWTIELDGGATTERLDLRGGMVARVDLGAGVTRATIAMPTPVGTQVIHEAGGATTLTISAPHGTATHVVVGGGASRVTIGGAVHSGVSGGTTYTDPTYRAAQNRLDIELDGGVSTVAVED